MVIEKNAADEKEETEAKDNSEIENSVEETEVEGQALSPMQEREALAESIVNAPVEKSVDEDGAVGDGEEDIPPEPEATAEKVDETTLKMEKIVVDGKESEVLLSDIIDAGKRSLQKESAADSRLEEATRLLKAAQGKIPLPREEDEEKEEKVDPAQDDKSKRQARIKELTEAIQCGTEEEGEAAIEEIMGSMATQKQVSPDEIKNQVKEELRVEQINERLQASPENGGFGDLIKDQRLVDFANQAIDKALSEGKPYTWELCQEACQGVRDWVDSFKPEAAPQKDELQEKRERKRTSIDEVKSANLKKSKIEKDKPQTASEIIADMRKVRGQA